MHKRIQSCVNFVEPIIWISFDICPCYVVTVVRMHWFLYWIGLDSARQYSRLHTIHTKKDAPGYLHLNILGQLKWLLSDRYVGY